jgi:S1-C subfamily serine protease
MGPVIEVTLAIGRLEERLATHPPSHLLWVGVRVTPTVGETLARLKPLGIAGGLVVQSVVERSPAAEAKIQAGDVLVKLEAHPLLLSDDLFQSLAQYQTGAVVRIEVVRAGVVQTFSVTLRPYEFEK